MAADPSPIDIPPPPPPMTSPMSSSSVVRVTVTDNLDSSHTSSSKSRRKSSSKSAFKMGSSMKKRLSARFSSLLPKTGNMTPKSTSASSSSSDGGSDELSQSVTRDEDEDNDDDDDENHDRSMPAGVDSIAVRSIAEESDHKQEHITALKKPGVSSPRKLPLSSMKPKVDEQRYKHPKSRTVATLVADFSNLGLLRVPTETLAEMEPRSICKLYLNKNTIKHGLSSLHRLTNLRFLYLDHNFISDQILVDHRTGLAKLPHLKLLWLNSNRLSDIKLVLEHLQKAVPSVADLSMLNNPLCPYADPDPLKQDGFHKEYLRYRYKCLFVFPQLKVLDLMPVQPDELEKSKKWGRGLLSYARTTITDAPPSSSRTSRSPAVHPPSAAASSPPVSDDHGGSSAVAASASMEDSMDIKEDTPSAIFPDGVPPPPPLPLPVSAIEVSIESVARSERGVGDGYFGRSRKASFTLDQASGIPSAFFGGGLYTRSARGVGLSPMSPAKSAAADRAAIKRSTGMHGVQSAVKKKIKTKPSRGISDVSPMIPARGRASIVLRKNQQQRMLIGHHGGGVAPSSSSAAAAAAVASSLPGVGKASGLSRAQTDSSSAMKSMGSASSILSFTKLGWRSGKKKKGSQKRDKGEQNYKHGHPPSSSSAVKGHSSLPMTTGIDRRTLSAESPLSWTKRVKSDGMSPTTMMNPSSMTSPLSTSAMTGREESALSRALSAGVVGLERTRLDVSDMSLPVIDGAKGSPLSPMSERTVESGAWRKSSDSRKVSGITEDESVGHMVTASEFFFGLGKLGFDESEVLSSSSRRQSRRRAGSTDSALGPDGTFNRPIRGDSGAVDLGSGVVVGGAAAAGLVGGKGPGMSTTLMVGPNGLFHGSMFAGIEMVEYDERFTEIYGDMFEDEPGSPSAALDMGDVMVPLDMTSHAKSLPPSTTALSKRHTLGAFAERRKLEKDLQNARDQEAAEKRGLMFSEQLQSAKTGQDLMIDDIIQDMTAEEDESEDVNLAGSSALSSGSSSKNLKKQLQRGTAPPGALSAAFKSVFSRKGSGKMQMGGKEEEKKGDDSKEDSKGSHSGSSSVSSVDLMRGVETNDYGMPIIHGRSGEETDVDDEDDSGSGKRDRRKGGRDASGSADAMDSSTPGEQGRRTVSTMAAQSEGDEHTGGIPEHQHRHKPGEISHSTIPTVYSGHPRMGHEYAGTLASISMAEQDALEFYRRQSSPLSPPQSTVRPVRMADASASPEDLIDEEHSTRRHGTPDAAVSAASSTGVRSPASSRAARLPAECSDCRMLREEVTRLRKELERVESEAASERLMFQIQMKDLEKSAVYYKRKLKALEQEQSTKSTKKGKSDQV